MVSKATDDDFLFLAEDETNLEAETQSSGEWHLLIVDDDEEIHTVTKLALSDLLVLDRKFSIPPCFFW